MPAFCVNHTGVRLHARVARFCVKTAAVLPVCVCVCVCVLPVYLPSVCNSLLSLLRLSVSVCRLSRESLKPAANFNTPE